VGNDQVYRQGHRGKRFEGELGRYVQKIADSTMHRSKGSRRYAKTGSAALTARFYAFVAYVKDYPRPFLRDSAGSARQGFSRVALRMKPPVFDYNGFEDLRRLSNGKAIGANAQTVRKPTPIGGARISNAPLYGQVLMDNG